MYYEQGILCFGDDIFGYIGWFCVFGFWVEIVYVDKGGFGEIDFEI